MTRTRTNRAPAPAKPVGKQLKAAADRFKAFRPASEVLTEVRAVPTCFVQFDHATRVGGMPIERFSLVHGPSNEGKTLFTLGLIGSFLAIDEYALEVDAERTTPMPWVREVIGRLADSPNFFAIRPYNYEATIGQVREFLNAVAGARKRAIVVVDSLRKLVPKDAMAEILKAAKEEKEQEEEQKRLGKRGKKAITAGRDRSAQLKAKMNAAWMDELIPLLEHAQAGMVAIAREMQDPDANPFLKKFGLDFKVGGGGAIFYDASLVVRIQRAGWVSHGEGKERVVYGERHRVTIRKTKVGGKDDKVATAYFHSSNGTLIPPGLDRARDVLELAVRFGLVSEHKGRSGKYLLWLQRSCKMQHRWSGVNDAVVKLTNGPPITLQELEAEVRTRFAEHKPVEHDEETGEVEENNE